MSSGKADKNNLGLIIVSKGLFGVFLDIQEHFEDKQGAFITFP